MDEWRNGTSNFAKRSLTKKHDEGHSDYIGGFALGAKPQKANFGA